MQDRVKAWFGGFPALPQPQPLGGEEPRASLLEGWKQHSAGVPPAGRDLESQEPFPGGGIPGLGRVASFLRSSSVATGAEAVGAYLKTSATGVLKSETVTAGLDSARTYFKTASGAFKNETVTVGVDTAKTYLRSASESATGAIKTVSKNVQELPSNIQKTAASMPSQQQFVLFIGLLLSGAFFSFIAFAVFLPLIALAPQKFASSLTIGSILIMASFFALKGVRAQLESMITRERLPFTAFYVGSMVGTLIVSMFLHSYLLSLLFAVAQVLALVYYVVSFFPGGTTGLNYMTSTVTSSFTSTVASSG